MKRITLPALALVLFLVTRPTPSLALVGPAVGDACTLTGSTNGPSPNAGGANLVCSAGLTWQLATTVGAAGSDGYVQFNNSGALAGDADFFWDNTDKQLGIGTTSPGATLGIYAPSANTSSIFYGIYLTGEQSTANTTTYDGMKLEPSYTASSGNTLATLYGLNSDPKNTGTGNINAMQAIRATPELTGAGTVLNMSGVTSSPQTSSTSTGTITNMYGVYADTQKTGTGAVTTMYGLYSRCDNTNATGAVTNCYELYLDTPTLTGAITNNYGVYQKYASATNYFAGKVGIGTTSPAATLDVNGTILGESYSDGSSTSIDWSKSNGQYTTASCGAFTFTNMTDGGSYTLAVEGTTSGTCSFSESGLTFKLPSNHGATTSGKMTIYSFIRLGTNVFVTWNPGY